MPSFSHVTAPAAQPQPGKSLRGLQEGQQQAQKLQEFPVFQGKQLLEYEPWHGLRVSSPEQATSLLNTLGFSWSSYSSCILKADRWG